MIQLQQRRKTLLNLTIFGPIKSRNYHKRSTAKFHDYIYVSGTIGDAFIGMNIKKKKIVFDNNDKRKLISRYNVPQSTNSIN